MAEHHIPLNIDGDRVVSVGRRSEAPVGECKYCDENRGQFKPPHDASQNCQSGKHPHCSCDTCF